MRSAKYAPVITTLVLVMSLVACGSTKKVGSDLASTASPSVIAPPTPPASSGDTGSPASASGLSPLTYEINRTGSQTYTTPAITTDNVLKVKFRVGASQGNIMHQASELNVLISVNGTEITPLYLADNWNYGRVGETSNVIDLSSSISPGVPVTITVKNAKNDFYCTYSDMQWQYNQNLYMWEYKNTNPLYNSYPGCRKEVFSSHTWSGVLIVQTNNTTSI